MLPMLRPLLCSIALGCAAAAPAADIADVAKSALQAHEDTVVTISCVLKLKYSFNGQSQDKEQKFEAAATTIDPSGLFVTSAESLEHAAYFRNMSASNKKVNLNIESEISSLQVLLADGTQAEADLVLSDKDLDLSFVRLRAKPPTPLPAVALAPAPLPAALDQVFILSRAPKLANRVAMVQVGRVDCQVRGPQPYLLGDVTLIGCQGCLAYDASGVAVGIEVSKSPSADEVGENAVSGRDLSASAVIRPIAAMLDLAKQALTAAAHGAGKSTAGGGDKPAVSHGGEPTPTP
jgi:hypothetical protein